MIHGKKLTKGKELAIWNLDKKIILEKVLLVVDWHKDEQPKAKVKHAIQLSLNEDLTLCYDKDSFDFKTELLLNHLIDIGI